MTKILYTLLIFISLSSCVGGHSPRKLSEPSKRTTVGVLDEHPDGSFIVGISTQEKELNYLFAEEAGNKVSITGFRAKEKNSYSMSKSARLHTFVLSLADDKKSQLRALGGAIKSGDTWYVMLERRRPFYDEILISTLLFGLNTTDRSVRYITEFPSYAYFVPTSRSGQFAVVMGPFERSSPTLTYYSLTDAKRLNSMDITLPTN